MTARSQNEHHTVALFQPQNAVALVHDALMLLADSLRSIQAVLLSVIVMISVVACGPGTQPLPPDIGTSPGMGADDPSTVAPLPDPSAAASTAAGEPTPSAPAATAPNVAATGSAGAPRVARSAPPREFRLAWTARSSKWLKSVVIAPWGDVISFGSRKLNLHAGDTGDLLAHKGICYTFADAFGFVDRRTGVLVCEDSIKVFEFPGLTYRGVRSLPGKARTAAFGPKRVAVGFADGPVRIYDAEDWSQIAHFALGERASALAMSPDGRTLAVGLRDGRLALCDVESKRHRSLTPKPGHPVATLSFSPRAERLLCGAGPSVTLWQVGQGIREKSLSSLAQPVAASWLSAGEIVAAGGEGLVLVAAADGAARSVGSGGAGASRAVDVAVSPDARLLCAAEKEGIIRCYAKGPLGPRRSGRAGAAPSDGAGSEPGRVVTAGRLIGHTGTRLTMLAHPRSTLPAPGSTAALLRHVLTHEGELTAPRWPEIALVQVDEIRKGRLQLTITEDRSATALSEGDTDPFAYDAQVRLVWQAP